MILAFILSCMTLTNPIIQELRTAEKVVAHVATSEPMDTRTASEGEETTIQDADTDDSNTSDTNGMDAGTEAAPVEKTLYGVCTISHYCSCSKCCGQWAGGATASGVMPTEGRTVAADLPFGTRLLINGQEYVVEDRGVSGMWIDIFCSSHEEALNRGLFQTEVYILR